MHAYEVRGIGTDQSWNLLARTARSAVSQIAQPGMRVMVSSRGVVIRYHVNRVGHIVEQSRYSA
jgi:hypothetical protein